MICMKRRRVKRSYGEIRNLVLENLANFLIEAGRIGIRPSLPLLLGGFLKLVNQKLDQKIDKWQLKRVLKNLEKREIIFIEEKNDQIIVYLKDKGKPLLMKYSLKALFDFKNKKKKWDRRWFIVFFDVPEIQRNKRDYLRNFLKQLGFYPYQKSVYLFPYECKQEINLIKKIVEGGKYMKYVVAEKIEDEEAIKKYFGL